MKTNWILLVVAGLSILLAPPPPAQSAGLQRLVATPLTGTVHIHQDVPTIFCADLDFDQSVIDGRIEIVPAEGIDVGGGNKSFTFTRMNVRFAGFKTDVTCLLQTDKEDFSEVGAQLAQAVTFTATPGGAGIYNFTIPKEAFLVHQSSIVQRNSDPISSEEHFKLPTQDVTGFIDFNLAKVHVHVRLDSKLHVEGSGDQDGHQIADIDGKITFPDSDGDGVADRADNCKFTPNPSQIVIATPVVTAPPNLTLHSCLDPRIGVAMAADVCNARAVTVTNDAPSQFAIGPNTVTWSGNDGSDPVAYATQTVTIVDTTDPMFTSMPPDILLNDCKGTDLGTPTATDDCAGTVTFTNNGLPKYYVGTTVVTWTAHDVSSNTSTDTQNVTVVDTVPPTVSCVATGPPTGHAFIVTAMDACGAPVIRLGSYVLANGETIKIDVVGKPGVQLISEVKNSIRQFHVGKGENMITATDGSNNVTIAVCP